MTLPAPAEGLILIPTPLQEDLPLEAVALDWLREASDRPETLLLIEEHKTARIRWLRWGLPRAAIERFVVFNEHSHASETPGILARLKAGGRAFLMSDGGLPAFCDPGKNLVDACHDSGVRVTASPFPHSIALAIALSGFEHREFHFSGFLPAESRERKAALERIAKSHSCTVVLMDTPYRLQALLSDLALSPLRSRRLCLVVELHGPEERIFRGRAEEVLKQTAGLNKREFVLVLELGMPAN